MTIQYSSYGTPRADLGAAFHEFQLPGLVADMVFPPLLVPRKAASLSVVTRENAKLASAAHQNGAGFDRVNVATEDMSYSCVDRGLEGMLTNDDRRNYSRDFDAEVETIQNIKTRILLGREYRVAAAALNTSTFTGAALYTDNSTDAWNEAATSIIADVQAAAEVIRKNTGTPREQLRLVVGAALLPYFQTNTEIKSMFSGVAILTVNALQNQIASILGIGSVVFAGASYNSADEGQAFTGTDIWADDYALLFKPHTGGLASSGLGRLIVWSEMADAEPTILQYREEQTDSDIFRCRIYDQEKIFDPYFGHLMKITT
jgi:hypothetical protein